MANVSDFLFFRKVTTADEKLLLFWANDPETRKWSFNSNAIAPSEHKKWFKSNLNSPNVLMLILEYEKRPAGLVRLERKDNEVVLNYLIASEERGKGLASKMLEMAMDMKDDYWGNIKVLAYTLPENIASKKSLEKAGFTLLNSAEGKNCYELNKDKIVDTTG
ncbi:GNAT family N-acetyltransferase [candidate division KSB1 bacterium]|nr:GNAT family N-acetyltransferase [candidate division KSB1 bacterium]MBL7105582.1 GNAT family N-acetyltransferase [Bacteroidales bacterium]